MGHVPWLGTYHAVPLNCAAPWLCEPPSDHLAARHRAPLGAIFCSRKHEKRWKLRRDLEYLRTFRQSQPFQVFIHINYYYYYDYYYYIYIYNQLLHMVSSSSVKSLASLLSRCDEMPAPWPLSRSVLDGAKTQWRNCEYWTLWTFWSWNMSLNRPRAHHLSSIGLTVQSRKWCLQILKSETSEEQNLNHSLAEF